MKAFPTAFMAGLIGCSAAAADDRLMVSANGSTLTDTNGGAGGSVGLLHEIRPGKLIGAGVEHQTIADARWTFGSLRGAVTVGEPTRIRWSFAAEANYGSGRIDTRSFDHATESAAVGLIFPGGLTVQLEDRQIDIDTTHGNLPKASLSYLWNPHWVTTASYSRSVTGNLGTELVGGRIDYYSHTGAGGSLPFNLFVGGAGGQAAPAVFNLQTGLVQPGRTMLALFAGLTKPFSRAELTLVGDYLNLSGKPSDTERLTLTLSCAIYLRPQGQPR